MRSIRVKSLPIKEVIRDLAEEFETQYTNNCEEYYLEIPDHIGKGSIKGVNFESGLGILQYDCFFKEEIELQFIINKVHPLKFLFCLEGQLQHRFEDSENFHTINQYQEAIVASGSYNGHILRFSKNVQTIVNSLEISRKDFQRKIQCDLVTMDAGFQDLFNDVDANSKFFHEGFYSLKLAEIFTEMQNFNGKDFLKKMFLEAKAYEMLTQQIIQYEDDVTDDSKRNVLRITEVKQIDLATSLIKSRISELNNINDIAAEVGLNANKLQEGFRILHGQSVNQYVQNLRLNLIKDLILNQEYSISEIADLVGISSKSYLTKIFKEEFGTTPSDYRKHFMESLKKRN